MGERFHTEMNMPDLHEQGLLKVRYHQQAASKEQGILIRSKRVSLVSEIKID